MGCAQVTRTTEQDSEFENRFANSGCKESLQRACNFVQYCLGRHAHSVGAVSPGWPGWSEDDQTLTCRRSCTSPGANSGRFTLRGRGRPGKAYRLHSRRVWKESVV